MAEIAQRFRAWFHVDAAWGGSAILSPGLRSLLTGIELADSVTWDAHKWLSVPMGAGMFFCRHPEAVKRAFAVSASYMPAAAGEDMVDQYTTSAQWSRRMIGLKVFMSLAELGTPGYAALIDHQAKIGDLIRVRLREAGWTVVNDTRLPVICFSHADIQAGHITTEAVLGVVYRRNRVWLSEVTLGARERVLRACVTSFNTDEGDVACLIEELEHARVTLSNVAAPASRRE
jgi:glutamate/tyrosine decarboxylase-like PLP-dependent enzyme